jgi:hypothetical protein
VEVVSTW